MPRLKKRRISDDFDDSPERKCKYIVPTERPYPYELVWGKMKSFPPWPGIVIDPPPPDRKPPGKKECYFYVYFFGSRDSAFVGSRHVFLYSMYHDECFENKNRDPSYIVSVKTAERLARHLKDERNQSERVFFNDYEDAGDLVFVPDPLDEIVVYSPKRKYQRKEGKSQNKACRRLSFEEQKKKPKKGDVKRQGTMGKRKKNHAVYATVNVKNYKKLITKELYVQLKRCDIDTFKYPLDFEKKKLYIKVKRCDEDKKLKNIYISALRNFEMNNV